ncbi:MAG TPA: hypothetical protein PKW76_04190 [bacterium]|nr:hypothetical protein [bacterium]HPM98112.1 hypothetical protein [bacterium]
MMQPGFATRGFYLHRGWQYRYPFAVRSWNAEDFHNFFLLLRLLAFDRVMIWPMTEMAPPPLSAQDEHALRDFSAVIDDARLCGLRCWLVFCPNLTSHAEIGQQPFHDRIFYPFLRRLRFDRSEDSALLISHHEQILRCLPNADGYVYIDGDPGGYPGAKPDDYFSFLAAAHAILRQWHCGPEPASLIPWIWAGWGSNWETLPAWHDDLQRFVVPFLRYLLEHPPAEPWEILPGRSIREGWANGRIIFDLVEKAGLLARSTLLTYEIVEFEPTPPAVVLQFDDIRRVLRQEYRYRSQVRGIMANAQQPVMALPNLYCWALCTADPVWLERRDEEILSHFASFLGGDAQVLIPAWSVASRQVVDLPADLPSRLRDLHLSAEPSRYLPGGSEKYLQILAEFAAVRMAILQKTNAAARNRRDFAKGVVGAMQALIRWWIQHGYVFTGEKGEGFRLEYCHAVLLSPLQQWIKSCRCSLDHTTLQAMARELSGPAADADQVLLVLEDLLANGYQRKSSCI